MENKINVIENTRGRYFGLSTTKGENMCARYMGSTDNYIRVYDRNSKEQRKLAKTSIASVTYSGQTHR